MPKHWTSELDFHVSLIFYIKKNSREMSKRTKAGDLSTLASEKPKRKLGKLETIKMLVKSTLLNIVKTLLAAKPPFRHRLTLVGAQYGFRTRVTDKQAALRALGRRRLRRFDDCVAGRANRGRAGSLFGLGL